MQFFSEFKNAQVYALLVTAMQAVVMFTAGPSSWVLHYIQRAITRCWLCFRWPISFSCRRYHLSNITCYSTSYILNNITAIFNMTSIDGQVRKQLWMCLYLFSFENSICQNLSKIIILYQGIGYHSVSSMLNLSSEWAFKAIKSILSQEELMRSWHKWGATDNWQQLGDEKSFFFTDMAKTQATHAPVGSLHNHLHKDSINWT